MEGGLVLVYVINPKVHQPQQNCGLTYSCLNLVEMWVADLTEYRSCYRMCVQP